MKITMRALGRGLSWTLLAALLAANLVVGARLYAREAKGADRESAFEKMTLFTRVLEQIRAAYVDPEKVSYKGLIYGALRGGYLHALITDEAAACGVLALFEKDFRKKS